MTKLDIYKDGMMMDEFKHLPEISHYNWNYYVGVDKDLLFAISDDDNTTEWFLVRGDKSQYIGESYTSEGDILHRYETRCT